MDNKRLMSLDALRGADMLFIMGFSGAVIALCRLLGFGGDCWLAAQMKHIPWHGLHHHDTIFPLFLFLAGVSWPFSLAKQRERGRGEGRIVLKVLVRMVVLVFLGIATERFFAFDVPNFRYDPVLAHIGVCWAAAALVSMKVSSTKWLAAIAAALLVVHWAILYFFRAPDAAALLASTNPDIAKRVASYAAFGTDNFSFTGNIAGWIDRTVMPGRLTEIVFDADGLLAKLSGAALAMLGVLAGRLLRRSDIAGGRKTLVLAGCAAVALAACFAWSPWCPVNKKLWTSTFILAAGAYSFAALALFYWIIDVKGWRRWTFFFRVIGMNSITIYLLMRVVGFRSISKFFLSGVAGLGSGDWRELVLALGTVAAEWLVLLYLYRKNTFLKV